MSLPSRPSQRKTQTGPVSITELLRSSSRQLSCSSEAIVKLAIAEIGDPGIRFIFLGEMKMARYSLAYCPVLLLLLEASQYTEISG